MNKKLLFLTVTAVLLVAAGCNKKPATTAEVNSQNNTGTQTQSNTTATSSTSSTSLKGLVAAGKSVTCTFSDNGVSGTAFAANGKVRTDANTTANNQTLVAHTLLDGQTTYTWIDGQASGFKTTINAEANSNAQANSQANANQKVDPNKSMNFNCSPWSVDNTKFNLPSGVQFMDLSSIKIPAIPGQK